MRVFGHWLDGGIADTETVQMKLHDVLLRSVTTA
jgi:hypothetical protein